MLQAVGQAVSDQNSPLPNAEVSLGLPVDCSAVLPQSMPARPEIPAGTLPPEEVRAPQKSQ
jgi:hypothetical protein